MAHAPPSPPTSTANMADSEDLPELFQNLMQLKERNRHQVQEIQQLESRFDKLAASKRISLTDLLEGYQRANNSNGINAPFSVENSESHNSDLTSLHSEDLQASINSTASSLTTAAASTTSSSKRKKRASMLFRSKRNSMGNLFKKVSSSTNKKVLRRRASQPELGASSLRQFLDEQVSQRNALQTKCQDYESKIESLQQDKVDICTRLNMSGSVSTELSGLVDSHAAELQKVLDICELQKQHIDSLQRDKEWLQAEMNDLTKVAQKRRASLQQKKDQLAQTKQEILVLKRDRKSLRKQLQQQQDQQRTAKPSPPPLLEQETRDLLEDFREQDEEAEQLLKLVGDNIAMGEAMKIVSMQHLAHADSCEQQNHRSLKSNDKRQIKSSSENDELLNELQDTCQRQKTQLEFLELDMEMVEEALQNAQQENAELQNALEEQQQLVNSSHAKQAKLQEKLDSLQSTHGAMVDDELQDHKLQIRQLQNEVQEYSSQAAYFENLCQEQASLIESLESENGTLLEQSQIESDKLNGEISRASVLVETEEQVQQKLQAAKAEVERLRKSVADKIVKVQTYKEKLEDSEQHCDELMETKKLLQDTVITSRQEITTMRELNKSLSVTIKTLNDTVELQKAELHAFKQSNESLSKEVQDLKATAAQANLTSFQQQQHHDEPNVQKELQKQLNARIRSLNETIELQSVEINSLKNGKESLSVELQGTREELARQLTSQNTLSSTYKTLTDTIEQHMAETHELKENNNKISKDLQDLREKHAQLQKSKDSLAATVETYNGTTADQMAHIQSLEQSKEALCMELQSARNEISKLQESSEQCEEIHTLKENNDSLSKQLHDLREVARLKEQKSTADQERHESQAKFDKDVLRALVDSQKEQIHKYEDALKQQYFHIDTLQAEKDELEEELDSQLANLSALQAEKEQLMEQLSDAQKVVTDLGETLLQQNATSKFENDFDVERYIEELAALNESESQTRSEIQHLKESLQMQVCTIVEYRAKCEGYERQIKETRRESNAEQDNENSLTFKLPGDEDLVSHDSMEVNSSFDAEDNIESSDRENIDSMTNKENNNLLGGSAPADKTNSDASSDQKHKYATGSSVPKQLFIVAKSRSLATGTVEEEHHQKHQPIIAKSRSLAVGTLFFLDVEDDESTTAAFGPLEAMSQVGQKSTIGKGKHETSLLCHVVDIQSIGRGVLRSRTATPIKEASISGDDGPYDSADNIPNLHYKAEFGDDDDDFATPNIANGFRRLEGLPPPLPFPIEE